MSLAHSTALTHDPFPSQCANTFDAHSDKAWALAVRGDGKQVVTGGSDSVLNVWQDCTQQEVESAVREKERQLLLEQDLLNAMRGKEYRRVRGRLLRAMAAGPHSPTPLPSPVRAGDHPGVRAGPAHAPAVRLREPHRRRVGG